MSTTKPRPLSVVIIGGGPAGLMAAEVLSQGGARVDLYDAMASVGRKFLLAGKGGLNLTHAEPQEHFLARYGNRRANLEALLAAFGPDELRHWAQELGTTTFIGTSGRVFPTEMKAAPLLRAWVRRLRQAGVRFHMRHRWLGWNATRALRFSTPEGECFIQADAVVLALGGGSWARLGSDGAWVPLLAQQDIPIATLQSANCGFDVAWGEHFRIRYAGQPVKPVTLTYSNAEGVIHRQRGEFIVTASGVEGGLIYAVSAALRTAIASDGSALIHLDLTPDRSLQHLANTLSLSRGSRSLTNHLKRRAGIDGVKAGLLRELLSAQDLTDPARLAAAIKALPLRLLAPRPLDEAISTAGGVTFEALDEQLMVRSLPGLFCAGEMLDWEAPTGGYLLTACFASGRAAGSGALAWLSTLHRENGR